MSKGRQAYGVPFSHNFHERDHLGPRMFIMYTADLAELADEQRVNLHSYADDSHNTCTARPVE